MFIAAGVHPVHGAGREPVAPPHLLVSKLALALCLLGDAHARAEGVIAIRAA